MSALTQKTLQEITEKNIQPISRWKINARNGIYWSGALLLVVFSALATAVSFHAIFEIDWEAYQKAHFSWIEMLLSGVPIFSLLLLASFLWGSVFFLQHTRRGYRYPMGVLFGVFFFSSVSLGYFIEESPLNDPAERFLLQSLPHIQQLPVSLFPTTKQQWSQPAKGLLGGVVVQSDEKSIELLDSTQKIWTVEYSEAEVSDDTKLQIDDEVKVIGSQSDEDTFHATEIKKWENSHRQEEDSDEEHVKSEGSSEKSRDDSQEDDDHEEEQDEDEEDEQDDHEEDETDS